MLANSLASVDVILHLNDFRINNIKQMFSYFGGEKTAEGVADQELQQETPEGQVPVGDPTAEDFQAVSEYEKQAIVGQIKQYAYKRRPAGFHCRRGYGL